MGGCDNKPYSVAYIDECGVCGGNQTVCDLASAAIVAKSAILETTYIIIIASVGGFIVVAAITSLIIFLVVRSKRSYRDNVGDSVAMETRSSVNTSNSMVPMDTRSSINEKKSEIPFKELVFHHKIGEGGKEISLKFPYSHIGYGEVFLGEWRMLQVAISYTLS